MAVNKETIDPRYSIGVPEMDREHAHWIALIERFRLAAAGHLMDHIGLDAARRTLEALLEYTQQHFANEEQLLATYQYPDLAEHRAKHRELTGAVLKLRKEIAEHSSESTPLKLNLFVTVWFLEHIMTEDWKYSRFILEKQPSPPPPSPGRG